MADLVLQEEVEQREAFVVAGISDRFSESNKAKIPMLWDRFIPRMGFAGQRGFETYGVCSSPDPKDGSFKYLAGAAIERGKPAPTGLELVEIPAQTYLVFKQKLNAGPLHPQMQAATKEIWSERLPKSGRKLAGTPDFEFYPADFEPMKDGKWVAYYIPVVA